MRNTLAIIIAVLFIGVPHGTHAAQTDWANGDSGTVVRTAIQANDTEIYSILSGTTPTLGPLNIGGTGDSVLFLSNNTTLVDDITGKYGIWFSSGVLQQIIDGVPSSIGSGSGYTTYPTYSDDTCTQGQYSFGTTPAPEMKCRATDTWDYLVVAGAALVWADWDNPQVVSGEIGTTDHTFSGGVLSNVAIDYSDTLVIQATTAGTARYGHIWVADSNGLTICGSLNLVSDGTVKLSGSGTRADDSPGWVNFDCGADYTILTATDYRPSISSVSGTVTVGNSNTSPTSGFVDGCAVTKTSDIGTIINSSPLTIVFDNNPGDPN